MKKSMIFILLTVFAITSIFVPRVTAEDFPTKRITGITPFGAGGANDRWIRAIASVAPEHLGEVVHVFNIPGAGGILGWQDLLNRPADGHTFIFISDAPLINLLVEDSPPISPLDILMITTVREISVLMAALPGKPWSTWEGLVEYAMENPGEVSFGGVSTSLMASHFLFDQVGIELTSVPYDSAAEAMSDFVGGHLDLIATGPPTVAPLVQDGEAIAVLNLSDVQLAGIFEDVKSASDLGYETITFRGWIGVHPETPDNYVEHISKAFENIVQDRSFVSLLSAMGESPVFFSLNETQILWENQIRNLTRTLELVN